MKKILISLIALSLITISISAKEKKKYVDIVKNDFYGVDNLNWGIGYKQIPEAEYIGAMGLSETIYQNKNKKYGFLSSALFLKKNRTYGFFNDKFYYFKIKYKTLSETENDLNSIKKLYGNGFYQKNSDNLINEVRKTIFESKNISIIFKIKKEDISITFINKKILINKNRYIARKWKDKISIEGWKYLKWDMDMRIVKGLLKTYDDDFKKWGWEYRPLNKSIFFGNNLYETKNKYFLKVRNNRSLKCFKISDNKQIFFFNDELFCVNLNFKEIDRETIIENLKRKYKKKVKIDEFENISIETKGTDIYINNNSLYFIDLKKSKKLLSGFRDFNNKI